MVYDRDTRHRARDRNLLPWTALAYGILFSMILGLYMLSPSKPPIAVADIPELTLPTTTTGQGGMK
jgi:hypothetical protein